MVPSSSLTFEPVLCDFIKCDFIFPSLNKVFYKQEQAFNEISLEIVICVVARTIEMEHAGQSRCLLHVVN